MGHACTPENGPPASSSIPDSYEVLTDFLLKYGGVEDLLVVHVGLWGPDTKSGPEALRHSNRALEDV